MQWDTIAQRGVDDVSKFAIGENDSNLRPSFWLKESNMIPSSHKYCKTCRRHRRLCSTCSKRPFCSPPATLETNFQISPNVIKLENIRHIENILFHRLSTELSFHCKMFCTTSAVFAFLASMQVVNFRSAWYDFSATVLVQHHFHFSTELVGRCGRHVKPYNFNKRMQPQRCRLLIRFFWRLGLI